MSIFITFLLITAGIFLIIALILLIAVLLYILSVIFTLKNILETMEKNIGFASKAASKTFHHLKNSKAVNFILRKKK